MALLGIFLISAMVMPTTTNTYASVVANPYCDLIDDMDEEDRPTSCHDRLDFYDGGPNNGLYPCNDGSTRTDWKDCPDVSGFDYSSSSGSDNDNNDDSGGSNPDGEEADQSCGGEPCTDDEKEDSWTDEEVEEGEGGEESSLFYN